MKLVPLTFLLLFAALANCLAQASSKSWQEVRDQQPPGLHLTMTLPKTRFHMGEVITATLKISNETKAVYHRTGPSGYRCGRVQDVTFRARAEDGTFVGDPLQWYFENYPTMGGGGGKQKDLGDWEFSIAANQWLQFEKPGTYQLQGWTQCLAPVERDERSKKQAAHVELVSDPVTITIEPITPEEERKIIQEAVRVLSGPRQPGRYDPAIDAMERLRYLQTPAATDVLLQYLDTPGGNAVWLALLGRPNYAGSAAHILSLVKEGRLGLSESLLGLYVSLKCGGISSRVWELLHPPSGQPPDLVAREELYTAARQVIERGGTSDAFFADLLTWYRRDPKAPAIRSLLIQRQLELPQKQIDQVFRNESWASHEEDLLVEPEFLPLIRELAQPARHNGAALQALAKLAPEEAKPIIVEDIRLNRPVTILPPNVVSPNRDFRALAALPDRELPELDATLRERLTNGSKDQDALEWLMLLIDRYATKALLPDVIRLYHGNEGHWHCVLQAATLRYWIRCDHAGGIAALGRALGKNGPDDTGCFRSVLTEVLEKNWVDDAQALVVAALDNEEPEVVCRAADLLNAHAGPELAERIIATIERVAAQSDPGANEPNQDRLRTLESLSNHLINNKRWTLTRPQLERVAKLSTDPELQKRIKRMLEPSANGHTGTTIPDCEEPEEKPLPSHR